MCMFREYRKKLKLYKKGIQRGDIHSLLVSQGHTKRVPIRNPGGNRGQFVIGGGRGVVEFVRWKIFGSHFANDSSTVFRSVARVVNSASSRASRRVRQVTGCRALPISQLKITLSTACSLSLQSRSMVWIL